MKSIFDISDKARSVIDSLMKVDRPSAYEDCEAYIAYVRDDGYFSINIYGDYHYSGYVRKDGVLCHAGEGFDFKTGCTATFFYGPDIPLSHDDIAPKRIVSLKTPLAFMPIVGAYSSAVFYLSIMVADEYLF